MKKKKLVYVMIFFIIVLVLLIFVLVINNKTIKNDNKQDNTEINNSVNNTSNSETDDDYIFYNEHERGTANDDTNAINNLNIVFENITEESLKKLKNVDDFYFQIKQFIFKHGLVDATRANCTEIDINEDYIHFVFELNNPDENYLSVKANLNNDTISIVKF